MHFLSHYYTELPADRPLFVAGLLIPDLTPGFSKVHNSVIKKAAEPGSGPAHEVYQGVLSHYEGDRKFHGSALFMQQIAACTQSFVEVGLNRRRLRLSVLAHVAVEMLIDRQIVIAHPDVCNDFYRLIHNAPEDGLIAFFNNYGLTQQKSSFLERFHFFKERRFLYMFTELDKMIYGLNRVYHSTTGVEFTEPEKQQFLAAFRNMDAVIRYKWQDLLTL